MICWRCGDLRLREEPPWYAAVDFVANFDCVKPEVRMSAAH